MQVMHDFDVIIIGSGIGGLISGGILTSKGLKILMLEKNRTPGGYLSSFRRKGFLFDSALDCISGVSRGGLISRVLEELGVEKDIRFLRIDPIRISIFPNLDMIVDADIEDYKERLKQAFHRESPSIKKFFDTADKVYRDLDASMNGIISGNATGYNISPEVVQCMNISYQDLLNAYFREAALKAILSDRCPFIGLPPTQVSALAMVTMIMSYFKHGAFRPEGGFQKLADALILGIRKNGGKVLLGNGAKKILLKTDNCCSGVICENDEEYTARYIISNADFCFTFSSLLGGRHATLAKDMESFPGLSTSFFILYAGVKGEVGQYSSIGYFPSYDMVNFFDPGMEFREDTTIGVTIASIEDRSRAPEGYHTVVLHEMVEASRKSLDKEVCSQKILKKAERIFPGIRGKIELIDAATPQTLQRFTGNSSGAAFGWRQLPGFRGAKKHGIKNLYTAGHWGDMGSGILASAYSGAKAANKILRCEGIAN